MVPGAGPDIWPVLLSAGPGGTPWLEDIKQGYKISLRVFTWWVRWGPTQGQVLPENTKTKQQSPQGDLKGPLGTPLAPQHHKEQGWAALMVPGANGRLQDCSLLTLKL